MKRTVLILFVLAMATPLLAGPRMKVVYSSSRTAKFNWKWPYHPVERYTAVQTKPYYYTGRILYISEKDLKKYRFYFPEKTCYRGWGYFFPPGTRLCPKRPHIIFGRPKGYTETIYLQK